MANKKMLAGIIIGGVVSAIAGATGLLLNKRNEAIFEQDIEDDTIEAAYEEVGEDTEE